MTSRRSGRATGGRARARRGRRAPLREPRSCGSHASAAEQRGDRPQRERGAPRVVEPVHRRHREPGGERRADAEHDRVGGDHEGGVPAGQPVLDDRRQQHVRDRGAAAGGERAEQQQRERRQRPHREPRRHHEHRGDERAVAAETAGAAGASGETRPNASSGRVVSSPAAVRESPCPRGCRAISGPVIVRTERRLSETSTSAASSSATAAARRWRVDGAGRMWRGGGSACGSAFERSSGPPVGRDAAATATAG